ncbi:MAG: hypothetical protein KDA32_03565 [Phycisphaerales bacterium]|nr:hypothetical protein [Phycisphaerales bacterium]
MRNLTTTKFVAAILGVAVLVAPIAIAQTESPASGSQLRDRVSAAIQTMGDISTEIQAVTKEFGADVVAREVVFAIAHAATERDRAAARAAFAALKLDARQKVVAMIPILYDAGDKTARLARSIAQETEDRSASRGPDFTTYRAILEDDTREDRPLPENLVRLMYESDPGVALLTMMRAHQVRDPAELRVILWAERAVDENLWRWRHGFLPNTTAMPEAQAQLRILADHEAWWARYFVAETMRQSPALREPAVIEALKRDDNAMVRAAAERID